MKRTEIASDRAERFVQYLPSEGYQLSPVTKIDVSYTIPEGKRVHTERCDNVTTGERTRKKIEDAIRTVFEEDAGALITEVDVGYRVYVCANEKGERISPKLM